MVRKLLDEKDGQKDKEVGKGCNNTSQREREVKGFHWKEKEIVGENIHVVGGCNNTLERR